VLPFGECPGAVRNISRLLDSELSQLRQTVLDQLPGTLGCTHLNDALRALAEVPTLVSHLRNVLSAA
jgi:signal transduction histidine kinase